jgi:hypothetical protein
MCSHLRKLSFRQQWQLELGIIFKRSVKNLFFVDILEVTDAKSMIRKLSVQIQGSKMSRIRPNTATNTLITRKPCFTPTVTGPDSDPKLIILLLIA